MGKQVVEVMDSTSTASDDEIDDTGEDGRVGTDGMATKGESAAQSLKQSGDVAKVDRGSFPQDNYCRPQNCPSDLKPVKETGFSNSFYLGEKDQRKKNSLQKVHLLKEGEGLSISSIRQREEWLGEIACSTHTQTFCGTGIF
ncbi:hypothetical protein AAC387_Pa01g3937 [Persea americana]